MTDIEDVLKKFIKRDDIDIILINQNVIIILLQLLSCLESMQLLIFIQIPLFFFEKEVRYLPSLLTCGWIMQYSENG